MKIPSKLLGIVLAVICLAVGVIFIFGLEFDVILTEVAIGSTFLALGISVLLFVEQIPSKLLAEVFVVLYIPVGVGFILKGSFDYIKADILAEVALGFTEVAFGFALLGIGITVSLYVGQMERTANFYFDDKKGRLMDYNQKICEIDSKNSSDDLEYVLDRVECDLRAVSNWKIWALPEKQEDLIDNYVIKIIKNAHSKDTCKNNRKEICDLIDVGLKIIPKHKELGELKKKNYSHFVIREKPKIS